jgi:metal-responsive CopG/Arc/MetJ family transcriptional regulator
MDYHVIAVKVSNREGVAQDMQRILTEHGCLIKVRVGLHDVPANACSPAGLVLMEVEGESAEIKMLVDELGALPEVSAKHLVL